MRILASPRSSAEGSFYLPHQRSTSSVDSSPSHYPSQSTFPILISRSHADLIRLFERAVASCGLHFRSESLWEAYIAFEEREGEHDTVFDIYSKLHGMPLYSYAAFHAKYIELAATQPVEKLAAPEVVERLRGEIAPNTNDPAELDRQLRVKLDELHTGIFERTGAEVNARWAFESSWIDYYPGTALDEEQMTNIMAYLNYMEGQGDYQQTKFLYERSLMSAANYEELWFRYITWLSAQLELSDEPHTHGLVLGAFPRACSPCSGYPHKHEMIRDAFQRACSACVAVQSTDLRIAYAHFEESKDRIGPANDIHEAVLQNHPSHTVTIKSLANLHRRQKGPEEAIEILRHYTEEAQCTLDTRGALVVEMARVLVQNKGDVAGARNLFERARDQFNACSEFWRGYLDFEIQQDSKPVGGSTDEHVKSLFQRIRNNSQLPKHVIYNMTAKYKEYLEQLGDKNAMAEIIQLDTLLYAIQDERDE